MPYVSLISRLIAQGHEVHFAFRTLHKTYEIFGGSGLIWHQAPYILARNVNVVLPVDSYAKVLHHAGYDTPTRLAGLIQSWRNLFSLINPDLIIFDYSPTAMLASRDLSAKRIAIGTGFHLRAELDRTDAQLVNNEKLIKTDEFASGVLRNINSAMSKLSLAPLQQLSDILEADEVILRTLPEMDHFQGRLNANYAGIMQSPTGALPHWPDYPGPRIFAYLKVFETLPALLTHINQKRYPTLIYADNIKDDIKRAFSSETLKFVDKPLDMRRVGESADIAITNAGHGSTTELLLSGLPMLLLPLYGEQQLVANNAERIGAALSAPQRHHQAMGQKLDALITDPRYRVAARAFAERYRGSNMTDLTGNLIEQINLTLNNPSPA